MGILSWWSGGKEAATSSAASKTKQISSTGKNSAEGKSEVDMNNNNGAMEVTRRPDDFTVFEFGSAADKVTLAGYCSVSEELEPCRWEILPGTTSDAPQFRVKNRIFIDNRSPGKTLALSYCNKVEPSGFLTGRGTGDGKRISIEIYDDRKELREEPLVMQ